MEEAGARETKVTVLVAEDEQDTADAIAELLRCTFPDVRVLTACDGVEALQTIATTRVDLLLTDHRMPRMDGLALLEAAARVAPRLPAIVMSGFADVAVAIAAANEQRVVRFLRKPLEPDDVVASVQESLAASSGRAQQARDLAQSLTRGRPPRD